MVYGDQVPFHVAMEMVLQLVATAWGTQPRRAASSPALYADMASGTAGRLVADFAESEDFRATLAQSADMAIDLSPEAEAAIQQAATHLPPVGMLTISQHGGHGQVSTPQAAASALVSAAVGVAAERLANAVWTPARGLDHLQSDRQAAKRTTAFAGYMVYRVLRDGEVVLVTDDVDALVAMTPEQLLGLNGDDTPEDVACVIPGCHGALTREQEDALWQQVFTVQPARRRVFEPSSKRRKKAPGPLPPGTV